MINRVGRGDATWLGGGFLLLYALTSARHLAGGDNPEFATLFAVGGVAHPSGYPLYSLYLRAMSWVPAASPAHGAALATAIVGALAVALTCRAASAWGASRGAAVVCAGVLGAGALCRDASTHAEVFAMNAAFAAAITWIAAPEGPVQAERRCLSLAVLAGFGLSNHLSLVLLLPVGLFGWGLGLRESRRRSLATLASLSGFTIGLTPYATLAWSAQRYADGWVWGSFESAGDVVAHALRHDYGTLNLGLSTVNPDPVAHITALTQVVTLDLLLVLPVAATWACVESAATLKRERTRQSAGMVALAASGLLAGPAFVSMFNLPLDGLGASVAARFYLMPALLVTVLAAVGVTSWMDRRWPMTSPRGAALTVALGIGASLGASSARSTGAPGPQLEAYLSDSLAMVPEGSIVLGGGDLDTFGFEYVQLALGRRRDVVYMSPEMLHYDWYRLRASRKLGEPLPPPRGGTLHVTAFVRHLQTTNRAVFVTHEMVPGLLSSVRSYPLGPLVRIVADHESVPSPDELARVNANLLDAFSLVPPSRAEPGTWTDLVVQRYARPWTSLARAYADLGHTERAATATQTANRLTGAN